MGQQFNPPFKGPCQQVGFSRDVEAGGVLLPENILERLASKPLVPGCCSLRVLMIN